MPLEVATYIDGLNASNPVGSTDKVQTLDDHVRLLKSTIKASFPGITGAVTPTHTELNFVDGVTSAIQTQLDTKAAAAALNASNLTSGTVPDARFPATLPAASGVNLTALNGTNIASGTVADARLSSNVALKNADNAFSADETISKSQPRFIATATDDTIGALRVNTNSSTRGFFGAGTGLITGIAASAMCVRAEAGGFAFSGNGGSAAQFALDASGVLTTPGASAAEVGTRGIVRIAAGASFTLNGSYMGKCIHLTGAGPWTVTIESGLPDGFDCIIINNTSNTATIADTDGQTLYLAGTAFGTTGDRSLAVGGMMFLYQFGSPSWICSGSGVS